MPVQHASDVLNRFWPATRNADGSYSVSLPIEPVEIASKAGFKVEPYSAGAYSAMLFGNAPERVGEYDGDTKTIRYAPGQTAERRRFTVAHELGHAVLGHGHAFRSDPCRLTPQEMDANLFAAALLMPSVLVRFFVEGKGMKSIDALAKAFGVSKQAMSIRLRSLGYIRG